MNTTTQTELEMKATQIKDSFEKLLNVDYSNFTKEERSEIKAELKELEMLALSMKK